jgi:hypothetical protein
LSGVQLVDFKKTQGRNNASATFTEDVLTVVGDGTVGFQRGEINVLELLKANIGKTISFGFEKLECINNKHILTVTIQGNITFNDGSKLYHTFYSKNSNTHKSLVIPEDITEAYLAIYAANATTADVEPNTVTITKPILYFGTEKPAYEPYCGGVPSPNPEFPQEIENVGVVRNLLDCSRLGKLTHEGVTYTPVYDENGLLEYIEVNGTATADYYYGLVVNDNVRLKVGTNYIVNGCPSGGSSSTYLLQVNYKTADGTQLGVLDKGNGVN